jgi:hypothetical protein
MRKYLLFAKLFLLFFFLIVAVGASSQNNSYLGLDGGLEGLSVIDNVATGDALPRVNKWVKANAALTIAKEAIVVRSGNNSLKVTSLSSTAYRVWSPLITIPESTTKWVIQYYRRAASTSDGIQNLASNYRGTAEAKTSPYNTVSVANAWEKVVYLPSLATAATAAAAGLYCKRIVAGGDMFFDDFCVYESATGEDLTAPDAPTDANAYTFTSTALVLAWKAPLAGTDGGGYLVVRGSVDPTVVPNVNGIYAVNNKLSGDAVVVYQGAETNFVDTALTTGGQYYYRIYAYDKAYNYSASLAIGAVVGATPPTIAITEANIPTMITNVGCPESETIYVSAINLTNTNGVTLSVNGPNADFFSLSKSIIEQAGGIVSTTPVRITYRPTEDGSHSAVLVATSNGVTCTVRNLNGTARTFPEHGNHSSELIFFVRNGYVIFLASERDAICVYNAMGQKILSKMAVQGLNVISLNVHGVIVLKVGNKIAKAIL